MFKCNRGGATYARKTASTNTAQNRIAGSGGRCSRFLWYRANCVNGACRVCRGCRLGGDGNPHCVDSALPRDGSLAIDQAGNTDSTHMGTRREAASFYHLVAVYGVWSLTAESCALSV